MYRCVATGKNPNYGQAGEVRYHSNWFAAVGSKEGWLMKCVFVGTKEDPLDPKFQDEVIESLIREKARHIRRLKQVESRLLELTKKLP